MSRRRRTIRAQDLLGRAVRADGGHVVGRIEEIRVDRRGDAYEVTEYLLGSGAFFERMALAQRWFRRSRKIVAKWDQIDVSRPESPKLLCAPEELTRE